MIVAGDLPAMRREGFFDDVNGHVRPVLEPELFPQGFGSLCVGRSAVEIVEGRGQDVRRQLAQPDGRRAGPEFVDEAAPIGLIEELRDKETGFAGKQASTPAFGLNTQ